MLRLLICGIDRLLSNARYSRNVVCDGFMCISKHDIYNCRDGACKITYLNPRTECVPRFSPTLNSVV